MVPDAGDSHVYTNNSQSEESYKTNVSTCLPSEQMQQNGSLVLNTHSDSRSSSSANTFDNEAQEASDRNEKVLNTFGDKHTLSKTCGNCTNKASASNEMVGCN